MAILGGSNIKGEINLTGVKNPTIDQLIRFTQDNIRRAERVLKTTKDGSTVRRARLTLAKQQTRLENLINEKNKPKEAPKSIPTTDPPITSELKPANIEPVLESPAKQLEEKQGLSTKQKAIIALVGGYLLIG